MFFYGYFGQLILTFAIKGIAGIALYWALMAGQFSLAHAAMMGAGAYASAVATLKWHWGFPSALLFGLLVAGALGLLVGTMSLRLNDLYLGIGTLAAGEALVVVLQNIDYVGGPLGMSGIPFLASPTWILAGLVAVIVASLVLERSALGKRFRAVADDETAAGVVGISVKAAKLQAFVLSGMAAGLSGVLFAHQLGNIVPGDFGFAASVDMLMAVLIGGSAWVAGPVLGAAIVVGLPEVLRLVNLDRGLLFGLILATVVILRPEGILVQRFGDGPLQRLIRRLRSPGASAKRGVQP